VRAASLESELTPASVEHTVHKLMLQKQGEGSGVGALGLVMHLMGDVVLRGEEIAWVYARLKPTLVNALECVPSLRFLDGG
jgi:hypothetical protein